MFTCRRVSDTRELCVEHTRRLTWEPNELKWDWSDAGVCRVRTWVGIANSGRKASRILRSWRRVTSQWNAPKNGQHQAQEFQGGTKPAVYTELDEMLAKHPDLACVDICALHSAHHTLAVPALDAGKHVIIEKPFGITMRACKLMMDAADRNDKIISVAENYRLARIQRTRSWAIAQGRIGDPRMFFWVEVSEGLGKWGWRNFKMDAGGGWALDGGVHFHRSDALYSRYGSRGGLCNQQGL